MNEHDPYYWAWLFMAALCFVVAVNIIRRGKSNGRK